MGKEKKSRLSLTKKRKSWRKKQVKQLLRQRRAYIFEIGKYFPCRGTNTAMEVFAPLAIEEDGSDSEWAGARVRGDSLGNRGPRGQGRGLASGFTF